MIPMLRGGLMLAVLAFCGLTGVRAEEATPGVGLLWSQAVAHMRAGEPEQALPLLDRLYGMEPGNPTILLERGLAFYRLGQDGAARGMFRAAARLPLDPAQRRAMQIYMARIEARRPWTFHLSGGLKPQSNPARRTELDQVTLGGMRFDLDQRRESGIGMDLRAGAAYRRVEGAIRPGVGAAINGTAYENRAWNDYTLSLDASLAFGPRPLGETIAGAVLRTRWIGDRRYSFDRGITLSQGWQPRPDTAVTLRAEAAWRSYASGRAGARVPRVTLAVVHRLSERSTLRGSVGLGWTRSSLASDSMTTTTVGLGLAQRIGADWLAEVDGLVARDRRDAPDPVFGVTRNETETRLRLRLTHRQIAIGDFIPAFEIGQERRHSPIGVYAWSNTYAGITFSRRF